MTILQDSSAHEAYIHDSSLGVQQLTLTIREEDEAWEKLAEQVKHGRRRSANFTTQPLKYDPNLTLAQNYFRILFQKLIKAGMRALGQGCTNEYLKYHLWGDVYQDAQREVMAECGVTGYTGDYLSSEALYQCTRAAEKCIENFNAETYQQKQEHGRKGGQAYSTYTMEDFLETQGMTAKQAAEHLGIKVRNVHNMRKRYKNINMEIGEVT
ncbi:hypothetical protein RN51_01340 [Microbacterium oxydans]|uniref:Uncharacterized protein n=1 Tax=Microbacterium oxydans TaxID=82380 RepID=A0A0F0KTJ6_9MICO|nr:hypothetical protein [Microbacterium oxydans]KJL23804.1 hypothetical protein RN51_01340 [Microbacterium oxydans]